MKEFLDVLSEYVRGEQPFPAVGEWLVGVDWDDPNLTEEEREGFGLFELLTTEISEGLRDEQELISEATILLTKEDRSVFLRDIRAEVIILSTAVDAPMSVAAMTEDDQEQHFWSISPVLVIS